MSDEIEQLRRKLRGARSQLGNVIFDCEQHPEDHDRHLSALRGVRDFIDAALPSGMFRESGSVE